MKNPLWKRIPRDLFHEFFKYIAIFLFMALTISFVSGFLVAMRGLKIEYDNSFEKYNIENGHFVLDKKPDEELIPMIEKHGVKLYENFYIELDDENEGKQKGATLRLFKPRHEVNKVDLLEGKLPEKTDEIALDRLFLKNNGMKVGEDIKLSGKTYHIIGMVALTDYSTLHKNNNDIMFDSVKFGVGIISDEAFEEYKDKYIYSYAWMYNKKPKDKNDEKEVSDDLATDIAMDAIEKSNSLKIFIPEYANSAIHFAGKDMGHDKPMMLVLLYVLVAIMGFVFAVTVGHMVTREATVIGTLRASGYTKGEIFRHYLVSPLIVTLAAALVGNILGYTVFEDIAADMYRDSYSLTHYVSYFSSEAFVKTTVIPVLIMTIVISIELWRKLSFTPLQFIRRDIVKHKRKKAVKLPHFKFFTRFRIRVILQNVSSYVTLFFGIVFAGLLLMFGLIMTPLLRNYSENAIKYKPSDYQYIIKAKQELPEDVAEKYCVTTLKMIDDFYDPEDINIYGIYDDTKYFADWDIPDEGVIITSDMAAKYNLKRGDIIAMKEEFGNHLYAFEVRGVRECKSSLGIYMTKDNWCDIFEDIIINESDGDDQMDIFMGQLTGKKDSNFYNGYFSDIDLNGNYLREDNIATQITEDDLTALSRQMDVSMGSLFGMLNVFALVLFALLIFLLTKLILEKNTTSISMTKILGYSDSEISSLYLMSSVWVVIFSAIMSMIINTAFFQVILRVFLKGYGGWFELIITPKLYLEMFALMLGTYLVVALFQFFRIKRIPMDEALKNVE
ncbi:MAG: ABC transporter permease [Lachnospiraceae bacterium]|nr:ABC transporter permease [Lachnospiraceae bacterium]